MEDTGPYGSFWGPGLVLPPCQPSNQNPQLICFIASSGPSRPTQPHTYWLLCYGQADTLVAEGPVKWKAREGSGLKAASAGW